MLKTIDAPTTVRPRTAPGSSAAPAERLRLAQDTSGEVRWKRWGPYLSERQWGTVREDYSAYGNAWEYFSHDQARSRAYRWGEDGLAGISDDTQRLCLALALWNGRDPILKERLFGLTNAEGNHSEDVKELYYYLDATPTHSYLKYLYKYPQAEFPYNWLVEENRRRGRDKPEFELLDTGVFDDDRYFDVCVEYAKASPEDILMRVTVHNQAPCPLCRQRHDHRHPEQAVPRHLPPRGWRAGAPVLRQREQPQAALWVRRRPRLLQGRLPRVSGRRPPGRGQSWPSRHHGRGPLPAGAPRAWRSDRSPAPRPGHEHPPVRRIR
jgi:hypothetical protein